MMNPKACIVIGLLLAGSGAVAQQTDAEAEPQVVEVSGVKNPELKPYKQMLKGIVAFETFHQLAPRAELKFQLVSDTKLVAFDTVQLSISGDNTHVPLSVQADGSFVLPKLQSAADDNAEIVSNKTKGLLRWRGHILTPDLPPNTRRLGDMRLECEIGWAVNREDMSFFARTGVGLLGGLCHSTKIGLRYQAPQPLTAVTMVSGERRKELPVDPKNARVFWPLLADTSWDDDTLVVYQFAEPAPKMAGAQ